MGQGMIKGLLVRGRQDSGMAAEAGHGEARRLPPYSATPMMKSRGDRPRKTAR
jgi:hypothetical protein